MSIENIRADEHAALAHLRSCIAFFDEGTREHEVAQKSFAFIANKIRAREKSDQELKSLHIRLCQP